MLKIGLTGGIGSGKTRVADLFQAWGAAVIDTDVIAHQLTAPGGQAIEPIRAAFGSGVLTPDAALDRAAMRELVFQDAEARGRLESDYSPVDSPSYTSAGRGGFGVLSCLRCAAAGRVEALG